MRTFLTGVIVFVVLGAVTACNVAPPPPPPPPAEGPQTKEEVLALVRPMISPIRAALTPGAYLTDTDRAVVMGNLRGAVAQYGGTEFGRAALREVGYDIAELGREAGKAERWRLALFCVDVFDLLSMESALLKRIGERAQHMMDQPTVRVRGFLEDGANKDLYVFMDLVNRRTGEVEKVRAREGEEFGGLRLIKVLGRNQKVRVEYLRIPGLIFDVDFEPNNP